MDTARTIISKEGKVFWKHAIVENGKMISSFANSKVDNSSCAEAYTILKLIYYLIEEKQKGQILIYCDNISCCKEIMSIIKCCNWSGANSVFKWMKYLTLSAKMAQENDIELKVLWVKGTENPADYYSRSKPRMCQRCSKKRYMGKYKIICNYCLK